MRLPIIYICGLLFTFMAQLVSAETGNAPERGLDGVWKGQFDINGRGPFDFHAIHFNGKSYAYSLAATTLCVGSVDLAGDLYRAHYQLFAMDGGPFDQASIQGLGVPKRSIHSQFQTHQGGDQGAMQLNYQDRKEAPIAVEKLQGIWGFEDRDGMSIDANFDSKGSFTALDTQGCEYQGSIQSIDDMPNVYELHMQIKLCASVDGEYRGVGFLDGDGEKLDHFKMMLNNDRYGFYYDFRRGAAFEYVPLFKDRLRL